MLVKGKTDRLAKLFEAYLDNALILHPKTYGWPGEKSLPIYLRELYAFYRTTLLNTDTLLMVLKAEEQTPATLAKHMQKVREKWAHDIVFVNESVSSLNRKRMIEQKIPFVIPGNQMFLPMLGVDLREHFRKMQVPRLVFSPSTQVLVLDALYHGNESGYTPTESAKRFGYSTMTMTRVFDELEQAGLGEHTVHGKERRLRFPEKGRMLWDVALPFLKSPVKKKTYIESHLGKKSRVKSGLSALAELSNLSHPDVETFAVQLDEWHSIQNSGIQFHANSPGPDLMGIELWAYPPNRFGRKGIADPLSVYLSLRNSDDERIQASLNELIQGMRW
ncbi:MAG: hypothetical protein JWO30_316 [Fibrobacteres bacterium]|nr:hypothetical protein [Fibrobacterota bacterium]